MPPSTGAAVTAAIITASASVVVAVVVFVLNQRAQVAAERRRARLDRVGEQLRRLYGPLNALVDVNEELWQRLHRTVVPGREERRAGTALTDEQSRHWRITLDGALMPANRKMRDLIVDHGDLLVETDMPLPLRDFCAHVAGYELHLATLDAGLEASPVVPHPGSAFRDHVRERYAELKAEQSALLSRERTGR